MLKITQQLAQELNIKETQAEQTIALIEEGNTIPFIARYRKEVTGNLSDVVLRKFEQRLTYLKNLNKRKEEILKSIEEQGKLTQELKNNILKAEKLQTIEDYYLPYKKKRETRGSVAKEKGLEPLALTIMKGEMTRDEINKEARGHIDPRAGIETLEDAIAGAQDIVAEMIGDVAVYRQRIRRLTHRDGIMVTKVKKKRAGESSEFENYYDYSEALTSIANHRVLAINRGEKKGFLSVKIEAPSEKILRELYRKENITEEEAYKKDSIDDAYKRLIAPAIERELRKLLTERAEESAIDVFSDNLKQLLLQPPVKGRVTMGFDPAFRTGCKIAVVDEYGKLLETTTIFPTEPQNKVVQSEKVMLELVDRHQIDLIAIGNGTASRESEQFVADFISKYNKDVEYIIVNEAGASVYSASETANEEYPDINVSLRGAISIGRRIQDPLAELVKIDPKHIGVGQYQHDVNQKQLEKALDHVIEDTVNHVGVDLNNASFSLLQYVAGINKSTAKKIVTHREAEGTIRNRKELLSIKGLGKKAFEQCAGFLRISDGDNPLDYTGVHPESYNAVISLCEAEGIDTDNLDIKDLRQLGDRINTCNIDKTADSIGIGALTLQDIVKELRKPGRDPRDELEKPLLKKEVMDMKDLKEGMILSGTVRNVIDFGAFVDIGVHQDGLVHLSEMSENYVKHAREVVSVGDIVKVKVLSVDMKRKRIGLSLKV
jgi:uncharacterized protein